MGSLYKTHGGSPSSFGASNPALGLPCGSGLLADFPVHDPDPVQIPFGSYTSANEFWSRLFPVAYATCLDDKDIEALDFIAP